MFFRASFTRRRTRRWLWALFFFIFCLIWLRSFSFSIYRRITRMFSFPMIFLIGFFFFSTSIRPIASIWALTITAWFPLTWIMWTTSIQANCCDFFKRFWLCGSIVLTRVVTRFNSFSFILRKQIFWETWVRLIYP